MNIQQDTMLGVLDFIDISGVLTKRALDTIKVHESAQKRASDLAPEVFKKLEAAGLVKKGSEAPAQAMLGSHAETLNLLSGVLDRFAVLRHKVASDLGQGEDSAKAGVADDRMTKSAASLTSPFVGRRTSEMKASDEAILAVMHSPASR